jgi:hypothetical protein
MQNLQGTINDLHIRFDSSGSHKLGVTLPSMSHLNLVPLSLSDSTAKET